MPDQNDTNTTLPPVAPVTTTDQGDDVPTPIIPDDATAPSPAVDQPDPVSSAKTALPDDPEPADAPEPSATPGRPVHDNTDAITEVATKINGAQNVLVALSSNPSVDELCCAIGLSLYLDRLGKHVTTIYSGATPNALEFLNPEATFEQSPDTLQDFVIALNKEKADHLRYKLDGEFVKIFITPYRSRISSDDLEFSYGDYNVDLVLSLDVANAIDLDATLREHGRIMHSATVVNITTGNPGKLGEIEWSDKTASSVSEMIAELIYETGGKDSIGEEEATAFLTGIVAATNRFATAGTTSRTMQLASRLMGSGANQQLISKNITLNMDNEIINPVPSITEQESGDQTSLDISHEPEASTAEEEPQELEAEPETEANADADESAPTGKDSTLMDDLKAAEASLAASVSGVVTPEKKMEPLHLTGEASTDLNQDFSIPDTTSQTKSTTGSTPSQPKAPLPPSASSSAPSTPTPPTSSPQEPPRSEATPKTETTTADSVLADTRDGIVQAEKVVAPPSDYGTKPLAEGTNKYGQMLEDALSEGGDNSVFTAPSATGSSNATMHSSFANPAASATPAAPTAPDFNGIPDMNYMPMPGDETLPPPPTPPIDFSNLDTATEPIIPEEPASPSIATPTPIVSAPTPSAPAIPAPTAPAPNPPAPATPSPANPTTNPAAFKIPGM